MLPERERGHGERSIPIARLFGRVLDIGVIELSVRCGWGGVEELTCEEGEREPASTEAGSTFFRARDANSSLQPLLIFSI